MAKVLTGNICRCSHCKRYVSFTRSDVKRGEHEYLVYGCEPNWEEYDYVVCPNCKQEIELETKWTQKEEA